MTARTLRVGEVDLRVTDTGGDLPAVLLLHGLAGHAGEWGAVTRLLADGARVIAFDQRGHGASTRRPADLSRAAHVRDVVGVAHALGIEELTLVGQSMGAHTALLTAAAHPRLVRRLVLVEGGVGGEGAEASDGVLAWLRGWPTPFASRDEAAEHLGGGAAGRAWAAGLAETDEGLAPRWDLDVLEAAIRPVHARARWAEWEAVRAPTALIRGERGFQPAQEVARMAAVRPETRLIVVPDAGHDVHLDAPESVARSVREMDARVVLSAPDPGRWADRAARHAVRLRALLPDAEVEHIGSTAIPGIRAKDVVDLVVGVEPARLAGARAALLDAGHHLEGERPGHLWFCHPAPDARAVVVHVVEAGGRQFTRRVAFRDALRADPALAREYEALKLAAADASGDWDEYTARKTGFVRRVLDGGP